MYFFFSFDSLSLFLRYLISNRSGVEYRYFRLKHFTFITRTCERKTFCSTQKPFEGWKEAAFFLCYCFTLDLKINSKAEQSIGFNMIFPPVKYILIEFENAVLQ